MKAIKSFVSDASTPSLGSELILQFEKNNGKITNRNELKNIHQQRIFINKEYIQNQLQKGFTMDNNDERVYM